jgi:hypothetical protein
MNASKTKIIVSAIWRRILIIAGYAIIAYFVLLGVLIVRDAKISGAYTPNYTALFFVLLFFIGIGMLFIFLSYKIKKRIKRFKTYVNIISCTGITSIDLLAHKTFQSIDYVFKDLQKMIDKKYFSNACINKEDHEIVIGSMCKNPCRQTNPAFTDPVRVRCTSCGAVNKKEKGTLDACEYCGSPI